MFKISVKGLSAIQSMIDNIPQLPNKILKVIETAKLGDEEAKKKLIEAVKTMRIVNGNIQMENPEIYPGVTATQMLRMLMFGSATFNIKPQLYLKDLILE